MATALVNVAFGFGHAYLWFCVCWGMNGVLQVCILLLAAATLLKINSTATLLHCIVTATLLTHQLIAA